jgi:aminopeptidase
LSQAGGPPAAGTGGPPGPAGPDADAFARLLTGYCLDVEPGQHVVVRSTTLAAPLLLALQAAILDRDAWPLLRVDLPGQGRVFYEHAQERHLDLVDDLALPEARKAAALLGVQAPADPLELAGVDPELLARVNRARRHVREQTMKRRWCSTLWPTPALAARAGMDEAAFGAFVTSALFLDRPDPVLAWRRLAGFQDELIARLARAREIRIEADGTDLRLQVGGRRWVNSDGKRNMPSGEVFTGPKEDGVDGVLRSTVRSAPAGVDVEGVELELRAGEVVRATAERGQEYLDRALATDDGARRLGELGIGTNFGIDRPIGTILFDEKLGGTVHVALGRSYPETGGKVRSALHWDLICDLRRGGRLTADGEVVQQDGRFVAP